MPTADLTSSQARPDSRSLAASLTPLIAQACDGRLGEVTWFKSDWQRGGAATGKSSLRLDDGTTVPVVLKLPVVQRELLWTRRLQTGAIAETFREQRSESEICQTLANFAAGDAETLQNSVVPRLYACGESLGGYDLAWIIIEYFPHGPLGLHWHDDHVARMADAAARFHCAADVYTVDQPPRVEDWNELLREAAESIRTNHIQHHQRWNAGHKTLRHRLQKILEDWNARDVKHWLHGDLHLANSMSRNSAESGPVCLIDLAEVHAGHWVEDAVYLERQLWARPDRLKLNKPVKELANARKRIGLQVEGDYPRLAMIRRALLAGTAPRFIKSEGHPAYLDACLNWLEIALNELK